jgi:hypothetical protein
MLHVGPYSKEGETISKMIALAREKGLSRRNRHHEIYLSPTPDAFRRRASAPFFACPWHDN